MAIKPNESSKTIVFNKVLTLSFYWFPASGFIMGIILFALYAEYGFDHLGVYGLFFTGLLLLFILHLLIRYFSKDILIHFTNNAVKIDVDGQTRLVDKKDIIGLFAPDYESSRSSLISLQLCFKNGDKLNITDSKFTEKFDESVNRKLKKDLVVILSEFGFSKISYNKSRALKKQGAYWYAIN